jgi:hypothetical protein
MNRTVVISQPMFFPWVGLLEQLRLADVYVHYDDVQFSKGSFTNRVQFKTARGSAWLTVPLRDVRLGQQIREVRIDERRDWRARHLAQLAEAYAGAPYRDEMLALVEPVYRLATDDIGTLAAASTTALCDYFGPSTGKQFARSSDLGIPGHSSERVLAVVRALSGTVYVTGHGARDYLDHESFERHGVRVEYIDYRKVPYPQLHGAFNPYVSALDLVANCGRAGGAYIRSGTRYWREFLNESA